MPRREIRRTLVVGRAVPYRPPGRYLHRPALPSLLLRPTMVVISKGGSQSPGTGCSSEPCQAGGAGLAWWIYSVHRGLALLRGRSGRGLREMLESQKEASSQITDFPCGERGFSFTGPNTGNGRELSSPVPRGTCLRRDGHEHCWSWTPSDQKADAMRSSLKRVNTVIIHAGSQHLSLAICRYC